MDGFPTLHRRMKGYKEREMSLLHECRRFEQSKQPTREESVVGVFGEIQEQWEVAVDWEKRKDWGEEDEPLLPIPCTLYPGEEQALDEYRGGLDERNRLHEWKTINKKNKKNKNQPMRGFANSDRVWKRTHCEESVEVHLHPLPKIITLQKLLEDRFDSDWEIHHWLEYMLGVGKMLSVFPVWTLVRLYGTNRPIRQKMDKMIL